MPQCGACKIDFSDSSNLRAHVKRKHPGKMDILAPKVKKLSLGTHECKECKKSFANFGNLRFHIKKKHSDKLHELAPLKAKEFKCLQCDTKFQLLEHLLEHKKSHSGSGSSKIQCSLCEYTGESRDNLITHFNVQHSIEISTQTLEFESFEAFQHWKTKIETETFASFIKIRGSKKNSKYTRMDYRCHRSGVYRCTGKNIRHLKTQGSNKIGGFCPAKISLVIKDERCLVQFCGKHVGHQQQEDLGHLFLTKMERETIAAKIALKIPLQSILDEIRDSVSNCSLERLHLLKRKDLYNIENEFNLNRSSVWHQNDAISVEAWVNHLKLTNCVLFYKPQDNNLCDQYPELKKEDFVLIIMTEGQKELLTNFGKDCICIDGTHGLNGYGFELHTILVLDDLHEGYPSAFLISNRSDTAVLKLFFSSVQERIETRIKPRVFMSDMAENYYNAWLEVMHPAKFRLFCTWHVDKAWRKNLDKVKNTENKAIVYRMLRILLQERDTCAFKKLLHNFLTFCSESPDTVEFAKYFKEHYASKSERWAYCFRINSGLNTNMHIERMHRTIKHLYLDGKFVKRLDKAISAIMKFVRDKLFERLIVLHKGKVCTKLSDLRARHKTSETMDLSTVIGNDISSWMVSSSSSNEIYIVEETKPDCSCKIICNECSSCIHRYSCTCLDSSIRWNMCKHIHLVCRFLQELPKNVVQETEVQTENTLIIDLGNIENVREVGALVESVSTNRPIPHCDVQQQILEKKQKITQYIQEELSAVSSLEEIEAFERILAPLKPTLAAVRDQLKSTYVPLKSANISGNKNIEPQRRLFATRSSKKKERTAHKPSAEECNTLAIQMLYRQEDGSPL